MHRNIFLEVEYLGTDYFGFQVQNKSKHISIQGIIEEAIYKLFKERVRIQYCSRTDRGVHARAQGVNFKVNSRIPLKNIKKALNAFLPSDIRVKKVKNVSVDFNARFAAKSKIYRYIILNAKEPSVFWNDLSWHIAEKLDVERMKRGARRLLGRRDFSVFAKDAKVYKSCIRYLSNIKISKRGSLVYIDIEASGFLRNMARNIVSFLVRVSMRQVSSGQIKGILSGKIKYANKPAPSQGLYLYRVKYEKI